MRRRFPPADCHDPRIRWNLPRGEHAREILTAARDRSKRKSPAQAALALRIRRIQRALDKLERVWCDWPPPLRGRFLHAIDNGVWAFAAHRALAHRKGQPEQALKHATRLAKSAVRLKKRGRHDRAREIARVAVAEEEAARLYAGMMDSRPVFAILIDRVRQDAVAAGLQPPPWSLIASLLQLASTGDCENDKRLQLLLRRLGRGKLSTAITTTSGARALRAANSIARKS